MQLNNRHTWNLSPKEAIALQKTLADEIIYDVSVSLDDVRSVAGVDVSVKQGISQAAIVVCTFPQLEVIEVVTAQMPTPFPYISGLLSFREGPVLVQAFEQLQHEPDVFIFDGMGRIHPRYIGIASHMGLWLQKPTIGCGKTHLLGDYQMPAAEKGSYSPLFHHGEQLGVVLRTRTNVKPVFISPGHLIDIPSALALTLACTPRYRLPRPIRLAHQHAGDYSISSSQASMRSNNPSNTQSG